MATAQEFSDVYEQTLPSIWHYVASRIPGYHEAQDVTSEVFTRAWASWSRFNPSRGSAPAWLYGIAHHTVADWWRRRRPGDASSDTSLGNGDGAELLQSGASPPEDREPEPLSVILQEEMAKELRRALAGLNDRERDALALRFGAGLGAAEVADILDLSAGATKMMISRAIMKLKALLAPDLGSIAPDEQITKVLDEAIQGVLARRGAALSDPILERVVHALAIIYQPPMPPELPNRVKECVSCLSEETEVTKGHGSMRSALTRFGLFFAPGLTKGLVAPCAGVCAAYPVLGAPLAAIGLFGVVWALHIGLYVVGPLNLVMLWLNFRRHGDRRGLFLASAGVLFILLAVTGHFIRGIPHDFVWLGLALLAAGIFLDWRAQRRPLLTLRAA